MPPTGTDEGIRAAAELRAAPPGRRRRRALAVRRARLRVGAVRRRFAGPRLPAEGTPLRRQPADQCHPRGGRRRIGRRPQGRRVTRRRAVRRAPSSPLDHAHAARTRGAVARSPRARTTPRSPSRWCCRSAPSRSTSTRCSRSWVSARSQRFTAESKRSCSTSPTATAELQRSRIMPARVWLAPPRDAG